MNHELLLFFCSAGAGFCLLFVYDWLRILRKLIPHSGFVVSASDFCFWIAGGIFIFSMMYRRNDGIIRSYAILGILLGMGVYHTVFSTVFVNFSVKTLEYPMKIVKLVIKRLLFAVGRGRITLYSTWGRPVLSWLDRRVKAGCVLKGKLAAILGRGRSEVKKKKKKPGKVNSKNRMSMLAIGFVVLLLFGILLIRSSTLKHQLTVYAAREEVLEEQVKAEKARTKEIDELKEYMQTDEYAEEAARERFGLVKDNEIVFQESESDGS